MSTHVPLSKNASVVDTGSSVFLTPGSWMDKNQALDPGSGMEKTRSWIRDKHPGSAALKNAMYLTYVR